MNFKCLDRGKGKTLQATYSYLLGILDDFGGGALQLKTKTRTGKIARKLQAFAARLTWWKQNQLEQVVLGAPQAHCGMCHMHTHAR